MSGQSQFPRPWGQVGLSVLPGLFFILPLPPFLTIGTLIGLSLASFWLAFKRRDLFDLPVWGLIPLGWVVFLVVAYIPYNLGFYGIYLLLLLISLPFSRKRGLSAGLFLLIGGAFVANFEVEPFIYVWDSPFWRVAIIEGGWALFLIVTPIWVLRSHTLLGQASGMLVPLALHTGAFVYALSSKTGYTHPEMFRFPFRKVISISEPYFAQFVLFTLALTAYAWIASGTLKVSEKER